MSRSVAGVAAARHPAPSLPGRAATRHARRATLAVLLRAGWAVVHAGGWRLGAVYLASQLVVALVAAPVLQWLFVEALHAAGTAAVDASALPLLVTTPLSAGMLVLLSFVAFLAVASQFCLLLLCVRRVQTGEPLRVREIARDLGGVLRRLVRPSSWGLVAYLFLLVPLAGFGFLSLLSRAIAIPPFISGELMKTVGGQIGYVAFLVVIGFVCTRAALTLPVFVATDSSGSAAFRRSWRLTRGRDGVLTFAVGAVLLAGLVAGGILMLLAVLPVVLTDAVAPEASLVTAAVALAIVELLGAAVVAVGVIVIAASLSALTESASGRSVPFPPARTRRRRGRAGRRAALGAAALLVVLALSAANIPALSQLAQTPSTLILAHRGVTTDAVENTIASLDAARAADVDLVEMDVMQTADRGFVVMHDASLARLADLDLAVADLTLEELTAIEVHDRAGNTGAVPSLAQYVLHAQEIGQRLLIEIKLHGGETDDHVALLVDELHALGVLDANIYHSLDPVSVAELKRLRPALAVGYTMALAGVDMPDTPADFVVVEDWSYTEELRAAAERAGLGMMVWTVNDPQRVRDILRDDVDGIITDIGPTARDARDGMNQSRGLSDVLWDAVMRYVVIF